MKTSRSGIALIKGFEGFRAKAYKDAVGVWTGGYGHTSMAGPPVITPGLVMSEADWADVLAVDLRKYEAAVSKALKRNPSQGQFDAMVSLCYNIGPNAFARSTVVRNFNAGDYAGAAQAFKAWNKAGDRVLPGLTARRTAEARIFAKSGPTVEKQTRVYIPAPQPSIVNPEPSVAIPEPIPTKPAEQGRIAAVVAALGLGTASVAASLDWRSVVPFVVLAAVIIGMVVYFKRKP